jgi:hypothetical protein
MKNVNFGCAIISIVITVLGIICFLWYLRKKKKLRFRLFDAVAGMIVVFSSRQLLFSIFAQLIALIPGVSAFSAAHQWFASLLSVILSTLLVFIAYWFVIRYIYYSDLTGEQCAGLAFGTGAFDVLWTLLSPEISNLSYFIMKNNGTLESSLEAAYGQENVQDILELYAGYGPGYYLFFGILALLMLAAAYRMMVIWYDATIERTRHTMLRQLIFLALYYLYYYSCNAAQHPVLTVVSFALAVLIFIRSDREYIRIRNLEKKVVRH